MPSLPKATTWASMDQSESSKRAANWTGSRARRHVVPGGFGYRGIEGKIVAAPFARTRRTYLGLCLGCRYSHRVRPPPRSRARANSTEFTSAREHARNRSECPTARTFADMAAQCGSASSLQFVARFEAGADYALAGYIPKRSRAPPAIAFVHKAYRRQLEYKIGETGGTSPDGRSRI